MTKTTFAKLNRLYEKTKDGTVKRSEPIKPMQNQIWSCGNCGKEYRVAPGQLVRCKCLKKR